MVRIQNLVPISCWYLIVLTCSVASEILRLWDYLFLVLCLGKIFSTCLENRILGLSLHLDYQWRNIARRWYMIYIDDICLGGTTWMKWTGNEYIAIIVEMYARASVRTVSQGEMNFTLDWCLGGNYSVPSMRFFFFFFFNCYFFQLSSDAWLS